MSVLRWKRSRRAVCVVAVCTESYLLLENAFVFIVFCVLWFSIKGLFGPSNTARQLRSPDRTRLAELRYLITASCERLLYITVTKTFYGQVKTRL